MECAMYKKILIAYNGTTESRLALQECLRLEPDPSSQIHILAVVIPPPYLLVGEYAAAAVLSMEEGLNTEKERMQQQLLHECSMFHDAGLPITTHVEVGEPVNVIQELVERLGIELVILGHSRHKPLALRWWRGSMDALLIEKIRCSILVAADPQHGPGA
jgi:nucleotide-binding universal stress UspA family protein